MTDPQPVTESQSVSGSRPVAGAQLVGGSPPVTESRPGGGSHAVSELNPVSELNLLTVAEVAASMRVSKMSVYRLIHAGEIEAVRFGRTFRIPRRAAEEYLRSSFFHAG